MSVREGGERGLLLTVQLGVVVQRGADPDEDGVVQRAYPARRMGQGGRTRVSNPARARRRPTGETIVIQWETEHDVPVGHNEAFLAAKNELLASRACNFSIERLRERQGYERAIRGGRRGCGEGGGVPIRVEDGCVGF